MRLGPHHGKACSTFVSQRNINAPRYKMGIFGADCEFPEFHQSQIDPDQTLYKGWHYDTNHRVLGHLDYKLLSSKGVHVSDSIKKQIANGNIQYLVIWKWKHQYKEIYLNQEVEYILLGIVDAKLALEHLKSANYFDYNKIEKVEEYVQ